MKAIQKLGCVIAVGLLVAGSAGATAISTLADLVNNGGTLTVGDKTFSGFGYTVGGLNSFDANNIQVSATVEGDVYYLTWGGNMTFAAGQPGITSGDLLLNYTVTANAGLITMIDQYYTGSGQFDAGIRGALRIDETVVGGGAAAVSHLSLGDWIDDVNFAEAGDDLNVVPGQRTLRVTKDINFTINNFAGQPGDFGLITLSEVRQSFHQSVPDGGLTMTLLGIAMAGLGLIRRRLGA